MAEEYYYQRLNKQQQKAYFAIREGLRKLESSFLVPMLDGREMADVYFQVRMDHPELFYSTQYRYRYYPDSSQAEMIPEYLFDRKVMKEQIQMMQSRVKKLAAAANGKTEREKEQYIHDFICEHVTYDKLKKAYSHEIIGALGHGVGVCEGIAKTVKILCDQLGIWCIIALSEANPEKGIRYRHAWNIIRIDGKYYHLDATFDLSLSDKERIRYDYFNLSDAQIFRDHEPVIWKTPVCQDGDHSYYREKKVSFTRKEEVQKRASQAAKKGKELVFQWRGGYLTKEILQEFLDMFREEGEKKGKHALISLNWPQAVIRLVYTQQENETQVIMEEANEGEQN